MTLKKWWRKWWSRYMGIIIISTDNFIISWSSTHSSQEKIARERKVVTKSKENKRKKSKEVCCCLQKELQQTENGVARNIRKEANTGKAEVWAQEKRNWAGKGSKKAAAQTDLLISSVVKSPLIRKGVSSVLLKMERRGYSDYLQEK